jgi:hypothetical protein
MAERRRAEWVIWRRGVVISFLLHLLIFLLWRVDAVPVSPFAAAGPQEGDPSAAAGGGMTAITLVIAEPRAIPRPPQPIFSPDAVVVEELRVEDVQGATDLSGLLAVEAGPPGLGPPGPGLEGGTGRGDGGNAAEGLNRLTPPTPRSVIIPPTNRSLRGRQVEVWVWVNEQGRVVADSTQLRPPTSDRAFNRLLIAEAARWVFEPARQGGVPVAAWFPYTYSVSR